MSAVSSVQLNTFAFGTTAYKHITSGTSYTTSAIESVFHISTPNPFTLTLQNKPLNYQFIYIKGGYSANTYPITIESETGTHKFEGFTTKTINTSWGATTLFFDGVEWICFANV